MACIRPSLYAWVLYSRRARQGRPAGIDFRLPRGHQLSELGHHRRVGRRQVSALTHIPLEVEQELITATSPRTSITQVLPPAAPSCTLEASRGLCAPEQRPLNRAASLEQRNQVYPLRPIRWRRRDAGRGEHRRREIHRDADLARDDAGRQTSGPPNESGYSD